VRGHLVALALLLALLFADVDLSPGVVDAAAEGAVLVSAEEEDFSRRVGLGDLGLPVLGGDPRERDRGVELEAGDDDAAAGALLLARAGAAAADPQVLVPERVPGPEALELEAVLRAPALAGGDDVLRHHLHDRGRDLLVGRLPVQGLAARHGEDDLEGVGLARAASDADVLAAGVAADAAAVGAAREQLAGRAVAAARGEEAGLGRVALPLARRPRPRAAVQVVDAEGARAGGVEAVRDQRARHRGAAGGGPVGVAVLVDGVRRALARALQL